MLTEREKYIWEMMVAMEIATDEEIGLVVALNGTTEQTLNSILYVRTGYRTLEQMFEEVED